MTTKVAPETGAVKTKGKTRFTLEGLALLETLDTMPEELKLTAYVFDPQGRLLGSAELEPKGRFTVPVQLDRPADVQLFIGPAGDPDILRKSAVFKRSFSAADWAAEGDTHHLKARELIGHEMWRFWQPVSIFVSGHVRNTSEEPIPYVKVEIFDVDRVDFLWPYLKELPKRRVVHINDLLTRRWLGPQPEPPDFSVEPIEAKLPRAETAPTSSMGLEGSGFLEAISPQPDPPLRLATGTSARVGEMAAASPELVDKLEGLTLTSEAAPWGLFPRYFYGKRLVDTAYTNHQGFFFTSFSWRPAEVRHGRLRFDYRPDIIVKVTQVIDGVEKVLYMDPYSSTRWNVTHTHIDLYLDDLELEAGTGESQVRPEATQTFFTRIGNDEVYDIDQTTGLYHGAPFTHMAYGKVLNLHGQLGDALCTGSPKRYVRMSYREGDTGSFTPITRPLSDTRVDKTTYLGETHSLGPTVVNGTPALYEVRNFNDYFWYNPDRLSVWDTREMSARSGTFTVRLEVFDEHGDPLAVEYLDGTVAPTDPPTPLPAVGHCDLVVTVNNFGPEVQLELPGVPETGVVTWSDSLILNPNAQVWGPDGRIWRWGMYYVKGLDPMRNDLPAGGTFYDGIPSDAAAPPASMSLLGIEESHALAFKVWAWAHVRNGYSHEIYYREQIKAVAVMRCPGSTEVA